MELKNCPFCGGDGSITVSSKDKIIFGHCYDCGARSQPFRYEGFPTDCKFDKALEAWNRRCDNG